MFPPAFGMFIPMKAQAAKHQGIHLFFYLPSVSDRPDMKVFFITAFAYSN